MAEFEGTVEIGYNTDLWGPYGFKFPINSSETANDGMIPFGDEISAVNVRAFQGRVTRKNTLSEETEIADLIDPAYTPLINVAGDKVSIKLQYPNISYKGQKATLIFELTLTSGAEKAFYFEYVRIR
ncbi:MAG: hypothetical protein DRR04_13600 [Gammaproteobacteria bacterium]|nr:MAG: hypothetical protein DRR04_13600 [Gammaproteobacteria bacterium]RLA60108.1 MAG: hypothetical protein DRQ89_13280 [Campylobacterota bacterium]